MSTKYELFKQSWLEDIEKGNLNNVIKGNKFAKKILKDWLDHGYDENNEKFNGNGLGDGGIDFAYFQKKDENEENGYEGDTWYIIQTEYGKAFENIDALLNEYTKFIHAIEGKRNNLTSISNDELNRLQSFKKSYTESDRVVLVLATEDPLTEEQEKQKKYIEENIELYKLSNNFEVKNISLKTLHNSLIEDDETKEITVPLYANIANAKHGDDLLIGSVELEKLYRFLKEYEKLRGGEFDLIYKKNVRMFLGSGKSVNKGIRKTIRENPEKFGLFNNGITIVVQDYQHIQNTGKYDLTQPYIVNGCQTTKIIYEELKNKLDKANIYSNTEHKKYLEKLKKGMLVVKIVKAENDEYGKELLKETTKYTNSQNTVNVKDFISLDEKFQAWKSEMRLRFDFFLEIQRGEFKSKEKELTNDKWANAFELIKIYGASFIDEAVPGTAYGKNSPFAPDGRIFEKITKNKNFGVQDLFASYLLQKLTKELHFGERGYDYRRGQTSFLFCFVFIQLLKDIARTAGLPTLPFNISNYVECILTDTHCEAARTIYEPAIKIVEDYMTTDKENSMSKEGKSYTGNSNAFLKNDKLGKSDWSPNLFKLIEIEKKIFRDEKENEFSKMDAVVEIISNNKRQSNSDYYYPPKTGRNVGTPMEINGLKTGGSKEEAAFIIIRELMAARRIVNTASVIQILNNDARFKGFSKFLHASVGRDIALFNSRFGV